MSNNIALKRGLNIPILGIADRNVSKTITPDIIAVKPTDFHGFTPRLLVRKGDKVLAGSPVLADKACPDILLTSPASGTVTEIVRGEKRKLLEVRIRADEEQEYVDFGTKGIANLKTEEIKTILLKSGLWLSLIQRPYGILANPEIKPKAIFVSGFNTAPLAADPEFTLKDEEADLQTGIDVLAKLTDGGVHLSLDGNNFSGNPFHRLENVIIHSFTGKHPAGNVGVQISHISPIMKGDTVWTISPMLLAAVGKLFKTGRLDLRRKVAVTGPVAIKPSYVDAFPGMPVKAVSEFYDNSENDVRFISGDVLTGENVGEEGFLGFFDDQITFIREGTEREVLGWAKPLRLNQFSSTRSYFSWLFPNKKYKMDTNVHGSPRAFLMSDVYGKVLPMDLFPLYLIKACITGNIDDMEKFGIYEILPEDLALCEFVDPSKNDIQEIIAKGINLMIKEMA